ncbi:MAG: RNA polymerase sigma factor [Planctomycetota bacterium]
MEPSGSDSAFKEVIKSVHDRDKQNAEPLAVFKAEAWPLLPTLLRVATYLTHDEHRAEDLVQEAMMRAVRHIATFQPGTNMKAWLMTILRRTHIDLHRKNQRQVDTVSLDAGLSVAAEPSTANEPLSTWSRPDELLDRFDDEMIGSALRALPEPMRWVLLLVDVEQMSIDEAAEALDVPPGTVKSRASRARAQLRETLADAALQRGWVSAAKGS